MVVCVLGRQPLSPGFLSLKKYHLILARDGNQLGVDGRGG